MTARLDHTHDARLNTADPPSARRPTAAAAGADAMIVTPSDKLTADVIGKLPASIRMIATFSVGYEHVDVAAPRRAASPSATRPTC